MPPPISPADLAALITGAAMVARRLDRKMVLPAADLDDLRQDLLVDLICRLPGFDARHGSIGAFANCCPAQPVVADRFADASPAPGAGRDGVVAGRERSGQAHVAAERRDPDKHCYGRPGPGAGKKVGNHMKPGPAHDRRADVSTRG